MAAFKLPKATDEEKKKRTEAIQRSYREAVLSPLGVARECARGAHACGRDVGKVEPERTQ